MVLKIAFSQRLSRIEDWDSIANQYSTREQALIKIPWKVKQKIFDRIDGQNSK